MSSQPDSATRLEPEVFYDWSAQGQPIAVSINLNLIDRLSLEVIEGFKSLPKRGLEIGGLLLGRVDEAEREPLVVIEDREVFHSEHLHGPSFHLSPHDREQWAALATRWTAEENAGFHAVGLFRSDTRPEYGFDDEDSSLARELFREGLGVFVLIRPSVVGASRATFGILRDGALTAIGEFPFQSGALRDGTYPLSSRTIDPAAAKRRVALRPTEVPGEGLRQNGKPDRDATRAIRRGSALRSLSSLTASRMQWQRFAKWAWIPLFALLAVLAIAIRTNHSRSAVQRPATSSDTTRAALAPPSRLDPLLLAVEHVGRELKLSWNHEAESIRQADYGKLQIGDGLVNRELRLDRAELLTGSISYLPGSGDVNFQLQVFGASGSATESIRSLDPGYNAQDLPSPRPVVSPSESIRKNRRASHPKPVVKVPTIEARPSIVEQPKPVEQITVAPPAPVPQAPVPPAHSSEAPATAGTNTPGTFTASFEPISPSRLHKALNRVSPTRLVHMRENRDFVPAKPVREPMPKASPQILRGVREPVSIDVRVAIDKQGNVTSVSLESTAKNGPLPDAAMTAARNWTFRPAHKGSTPVASQAVLHFRVRNPDVAQADRSTAPVSGVQ